MRALIVLLFASGLGCGGSPAKCDMSSDDSLNDLVTKKTGTKLVEPCVRRSATFGVAQVGPLVSDLGCAYQHTIHQCRVDDPTTQATAMATAGWKTGDAAARARLAYAWLEEVVLDGGAVLKDQPAAFPVAGKTFEAPGFIAEDGGGVRLRYWTEANRGMLPGQRFTLRETVFNADGLIIFGRDLDRFETRD